MKPIYVIVIQLCVLFTNHWSESESDSGFDTTVVADIMFYNLSAVHVQLGIFFVEKPQILLTPMSSWMFLLQKLKASDLWKEIDGDDEDDFQSFKRLYVFVSINILS